MGGIDVEISATVAQFEAWRKVAVDGQNIFIINFISEKTD